MSWEGYEIATTEFLPDVVESEVVIMHGAGQASQERLVPLADGLARLGCRTVTFDFISHGRSSGELEELNLEKRQKQAEFILQNTTQSNHITLVGFSMSGQTSIDVADNDPRIHKLVLIAPAVYDRAAREQYFGLESGFSQAIRRPNSWKDSDAWAKLGRFTGDLLVMQAEHDTVIPNELPGMLLDSAQSSHRSIQVLLQGLPHMLAKYTSESPDAATWFAKSIANFAKNKPLAEPTQKVPYQIIADITPSTA